VSDLNKKKGKGLKHSRFQQVCGAINSQVWWPLWSLGKLIENFLRSKDFWHLVEHGITNVSNKVNAT